MHTPLPDDRVHQALSDRYAVERELGRGGMATVYLAEDLKHRRRVAVKVLHADLAQALGAERFLREIEIAANLRHPHILPLYDSGQANQPTAPTVLYFVMPYVEGESLRSRLQRERQLPIDEALRIAREVADALSYAHAHGVVHRDIKPENILLESGHAVVADFGIAKAVAAAGEASALTATGMSVGTPAYMSPEQASGDPGLDGRSDLYSLGCVLYEMLAGQAPFTGPTVESLVRQHMVTPPPPVTQFRPAVPAAVADAVARALAKNPADRFNPVGQFATALAEVVRAPSASRPALRAAAVVTALALGAAAWLWLRPQPVADDRSIAVLPFAQLGDTASALALGMHAEIVTQLTRTPGLRVASRSSSLEYRDSDKRERDIAAELRVATLLTGSMQQSGDQVRFTLALSDPVAGRQLWAESYDRRLTAENVFAMQAEVAREVSAAMQVQLSPAQEAELARPQTSDLAALERYYRGIASWEDRSPFTDTTTVRFLEEAVAQDSAFAAAWGLLAQARAWLIRTGAATDTMPASHAVDRVRALAPGTLYAHMARGYYLYYALADFRGALDEFTAAERIVPNSSELMLARSLLLRRLGRFEESLALELRAAELDPRNRRIAIDIADTYRFLHRYAESERAVDRTLALAPNSPSALLAKVRLLLTDVGDTARASQFAAEAVPRLPAAIAMAVQMQVAHYRRDAAAVLRTLDTMPLLAYQMQQTPVEAIRALHLAGRGDRAGARAAAGRLLRSADSASADRRAQGTRDPFANRALGEMFGALALALRGDTAQAIARAEAAARGFPPERDAIEGPGVQRWLAAVYAHVGRRRESVALLRHLRATPSSLGLGELRFDPLWDPLRGDAEFEGLR